MDVIRIDAPPEPVLALNDALAEFIEQIHEAEAILRKARILRDALPANQRTWESWELDMLGHDITGLAYLLETVGTRVEGFVVYSLVRE